ncbi:hypothetical protein ACHAXS_011586 [Conticribra weissflogii]
MTSRFDDNIPLPPGTASVLKVTCMDVVMGRGSGTQNHCGNVTYRKLVFLNKELYATSSKFDKLKISKAIVRAVREKGGHFLEMKDKLYFDIGDKRAWDKTSQALREGQTEIRKRLEQEEARRKESKSSSQSDGASKVAQYKQIISDHRFLDYSKRVLESLYNPSSSAAANLPTTESTPGVQTPEAVQHACGPDCPHARRRETLNKASAELFAIHQAMRGRKASHVPHPTLTSQQSYTAYQQLNHIQSVQPVHHNQHYASETTPAQNDHEYFQVGNSTGRGIDPIPLHELDWQPAELPFREFNYRHDCHHAYTNNLQPRNADVNAASEASNPRENLDSFEPLPYDIETKHDNFRGSRYTIASADTITSLRDILGAIDFDLVPDEGRSSMDSMLSKEIDSLIRTQSDALQYIDAFKAFEDLIFEEDSIEFLSPNPRTGRISDLTNKDDISLMNMSFLTIDEKRKDGNDQIEGMKRQPVDGLLGKDWLSYEINEDNGYRQTSCSNISMMSMDGTGSFLDLIDVESNANDDSQDETPPDVTAMLKKRGFSRKMGFPVRKTVAKDYVEGLPTAIGQSSGEGRGENISSLTITEGTVFDSDKAFSQMAAQVADPEPNEPVSSLSDINVSQMSLTSEM